MFIRAANQSLKNAMNDPLPKDPNKTTQPQEVPTSPLTGKKDVEILCEVSIEDLVKRYSSLFGIDIRPLVPEGLDIVALCRCRDSGFRFYHPNCVVGDSGFYERLQVHSWYYQDAKWEFAEAIRNLEGGRILEVGSARGAFLTMARSAFPAAEVVGLELNKSAALEATRRGLDVRVESSSEHADSRLGYYDSVVTFQVLEHVPDPLPLLRDMVAMLRRNGKLIIAVPDNTRRSSPSLFISENEALNMPPHHQGLWDIPSLSYLTKLLPIRLESVMNEPSEYVSHRLGYRALLKSSLLASLGKHLGMCVYAVSRPFFNYSLSVLKEYLPAHSVFAVFVKQE